MRSIFELENRLNIGKEFEKIMGALQKEQCAVEYNSEDGMPILGSFMDAVENTVFLQWRYRDTFLSVSEYLAFLNKER